jgi:hypothetical protein
MPTGRQRSCSKGSNPESSLRPNPKLLVVVAKRLHANVFWMPAENADKHRIKVGGWSFQKLKQPLQGPSVFGANQS